MQLSNIIKTEATKALYMKGSFN